MALSTGAAMACIETKRSAQGKSRMEVSVIWLWALGSGLLALRSSNGPRARSQEPRAASPRRRKGGPFGPPGLLSLSTRLSSVLHAQRLGESESRKWLSKEVTLHIGTAPRQ